MDKQLETILKNSTPVFQNIDEFEDADDEMQIIAGFIKQSVKHNSHIEPNRVKFLYSNKPKKEGNNYGLFELRKIENIYKYLNSDFDFFLTVYYDVWKDLEPEHKLIMLDKALCGIDMGNMETQKIGKNPHDVKEYKANMKHFGGDKVMETSEIVNLACRRIIEEKKDKAKAAREEKKGKRVKNNAQELEENF